MPAARAALDTDIRNTVEVPLHFLKARASRLSGAGFCSNQALQIIAATSANRQ
jgi:hypothetical protein